MGKPGSLALAADRDDGLCGVGTGPAGRATVASDTRKR